jgi:hypothetical protein
MRRMMLIDASCPSNNEAAVTKRTLLAGAPPGVAPGLAVAVLLTSERSVIVSTALLCGWLPHAGDSDDRTDEGRTII